MANSAETAYLSFQDQELSKAIRIVKLRGGKVAVHTFLGVVPSQAAHAGFRAGVIESRNFFVSRPILVKLHIRTRLIEIFPTTFQTWRCAEEKLHFTPFHTLRQLKRDELYFHHFGGS